MSSPSCHGSCLCTSSTPSASWSSSALASSPRPCSSSYPSRLDSLFPRLLPLELRDLGPLWFGGKRYIEGLQFYRKIFYECLWIRELIIYNPLKFLYNRQSYKDIGRNLTKIAQNSWKISFESLSHPIPVFFLRPNQTVIPVFFFIIICFVFIFLLESRVFSIPLVFISAIHKGLKKKNPLEVWSAGEHTVGHPGSQGLGSANETSISKATPECNPEWNWHYTRKWNS